MSRRLITCRGCGCNDLQACAGGCWWVALDVPGHDGPQPTGVRSACAIEVGWDMWALATMGTEPAEAARRVILSGDAA